MSSNDITFVARLRDQITGPTQNVIQSLNQMGAQAQQAGQGAASAHQNAGQAASQHANATQQAASSIGQAFQHLESDAQQSAQAFQGAWNQASAGTQQVVQDLSSAGTQMISESQQIGQTVGGNLQQGIQSGIDSIDVSGLTTALGGLTVGGGVMGSLDQDRTARRIGAASGTDHEAIRGLVGGVYGAGLGADYESVAGSAWALVATIEIEPGSPEAERLLMGQMGIADAYQLPADRLALATKILMDSDSLTASASQDVIAAALKQSNPGAQDEVLDALLEYGPLLRGTGIDNSVLASALAAASANGPMAVDKTGDAFKEWAVRASTADKTTMDAYAELGMDGGSISSRLQEGDAGALRDTASALLDVQDEATRARLAMEIMGAPLEDLGPAQITEHLKAWEDMESGVLDTAGATSSLVSALTSGAGADTTTMVRALSGAFVAVGDALAPVVTPLANIVTLLAKPIAGVATGLTAYGLISRLPGGAALAKGALKALFRVLAFTPLGRVVTLLTGVGYGLKWLYDNVGPVRTAFDWLADSMDRVFDTFDLLGDKIDTLVQEKLPALHTALTFGSGATPGDDRDWGTRLTDYASHHGEEWGLPDLSGGGRGEKAERYRERGFFTGGRTGGASPYEERGVVHGQEFVVDHWATSKLDSDHPGALDAIGKGKLPVQGVPVPVGAGGGGSSPVVFNQNFTLGAGADANTAREFAAQWKREMAAYARTSRLTHSTLTARGAH